MTSYDGSVSANGSSGSAGRRRVLGRGPGAAPAEATAPPAETEPVSPAAESLSVAEESSSPAAGRPLYPPSPKLPTSLGQGGPPSPGGTTAHNAGGAVDVPPVAEPEPEPQSEPEPESEPASEAVSEAEVEASSAESGDGVFKVRLANFEGPFDLLLQLISKHKLDVTEVALSKVTDEFMAHIRAMGPDWDLDQTTEFLVVAATLLDLKAARLLPAAEVEDEADLALLEARDLLFARLLQYRAYKQIAEIFNRRTDDEARRYPRTVGLEPQHAELLPEVVISIGPEGFAKLAVKAMQPKPKPQVYVDHIHAPLVSVQEQAGIVVARLRELGEASFRLLVEDTDDTLTVVARFLALLELYREKAVALEQEAALGELLVRWTGGEGDQAPMVTDEFDRPPEEPKEEKKA
ncbi:segregation and condensation protein A [Streptomyces yaanensis]|uniref:Segregation and condensation protein A n=1 Tax=Streptomyces yaanensis TaxID=1142239 RepID=A0ABV7SK67_9ACTN|nr:segregation/condensation protein A [Streptomyces sp. CGMCC 4.7035]WNC00966.1 segregation/condensation protein A [Streptomyces sp. CGMCC 4.7035]